MAKKNVEAIIKETIDSFVSPIRKVNSEYRLQDLDELYGYMWLKPNVTNIDVDIFVDDGEAYVRDNHVPLLFVRNGLGKDIIRFIPISISESPRILDSSMVINLNTNTIKQIFDFIKINANTLMNLANGKTSADEFVTNLEVSSFAVTEER